MELRGKPLTIAMQWPHL